MKLRLFTVLLGAAIIQAAPLAGEGWFSRGLDIEQSQKGAIELEQGVSACLDVPLAYRPDCTGYAFRKATRQLENNADYWEADVVLTRVVRKTERLVQAMKDDKAERLRHDGFRLRAVTSPVGAMAFVRETVVEAAGQMETLSPYEKRLFAPIFAALKTASRRLAGDASSS
jgi:hypothetical protein